MEFAGLPIHAVILLAVLAASTAALLPGNETDRLSLLAFKAALSDPDGALSSWNDTVGFCQWPGVTCGSRHTDRVTVLILYDVNLAGPISPSLANLTFLRRLFLPDTNLHGGIPPELFQMPRLAELYLKSNLLTGEIPASISNSTSLLGVSFTDNLLTGEIPADIGALSTLQALNLGYNSLSGTIPSSLGNLSSSFRGIAMQNNNLRGGIPESLGNLRGMRTFQAYNNTLSGTIPSSLFNISTIKVISLGNNQLTGILPPAMFNTLPNIARLLLSMNNFHGPLPISLSNASMMTDLELSNNGFSGVIPDLGLLRDLLWVELSGNMLEARDETEWGFLASLSNCSLLQVLGLEGNNLSGILPNSIADLPPMIDTLMMGGNQISGRIPEGIGNLINLTRLFLSDNRLIGEVPSTIGHLWRLNALKLGGNKLEGGIPLTISNLTELTTLHLQRNMLNGSIPAGLGSCSSLQELDLSDNRLTGPIPKEVVMLGSLSTLLNLSNNLLSGSLPPQVSNLKNLRWLDLSANRLSGGIPGTLGDCQSLEFLYMQGNDFQGTVPQTVSNLKGLLVLDLSNNSLSGGIPTSLQQLHGLQQLNLSFNNLEGEVPKDGVFVNASAFSITGNNNLCGGIKKLELPSCLAPTNKNKKRMSHAVKIGIIVPCICLGIIILAMIVWALLHHRRKLRKKQSFQSPMEDPFLKISYAELLKATDRFSSSNLIGTGSFSSVYKGVLESNQETIAVKVLNLRQRGASKTFEAECEALKHIRHRNLVRIITICSSTDFQGNDFKALVMKYMVNGSLEKWLHRDASEDSNMKVLTLDQRLNVAIDVASALSYLHEYGHTPIIHRDLKPSNVLLDEDMCAHISDFGLAKFNNETAVESKEAIMSAGIKGTIGYLAPEYGMGAQASCQGDVYSYGILLLELFTGKRPTDSMFSDVINLRNYVKIAIAQGSSDIADPSLFSSEEDRNEHSTRVIYAMRIGLACSEEDSRERMTIVDAIAEFRSLV